MGCGCKNNSQNQQGQQPAVNTQAAEKLKQQTNESIKQHIKKTVEKYYNVQKKTNGFVPE